MKLRSLSTLNNESRRLAFDLEALPWAQGVDPGLRWCPEELTHLFYCPSYATLTEPERLYYNQLFAMGVCEQFILLEDTLLVRGMRRIIDSTGPSLPAELRDSMENLIVEEQKHGAMFRRLLRLSAPDLYRDHDFALYQLSPFENRLVDFFLWGTPVFNCWVFIAMLFEEKSIDFFRRYIACDDARHVDTLYREVHRAHAQEESRHIQIDQHLIERFWERSPAWKRKLNHWIYFWIMTSFARPERTVRRMLDLLVARHPCLASRHGELLAEVLAVAGDPAWQRASYSRKSLPRTFDIFDRYPDFSLLKRIFPQYRSEGGAASRPAERVTGPTQ